MTADAAHSFRTGLARSVLREIAEHLTVLAATGTPAAIDLRSLPMTEADRTELERTLGYGEVAAALDSIGASEIWETAYAGVWWIRHRGAEEAIAAERIEIAAVPELLITDRADIAGAAARLASDLAGNSTQESAAYV